MTTNNPGGLEAARDAIVGRQRFLITSHARPDGDSIGSQLAMAFALDALGKTSRIVNADPAPAHYASFPGMDRIEIASSVEGDYDALIVMECGDLRRPGVAGLDGYFTINIDHHLGNTGYGDVNWFDETAAACTELVFPLIESLGVTPGEAIGTHVYLGILTDTGSFHHGFMTERTFAISRACVAAGVDAAAMARQVFDSSSIGKLRLIGSILEGMQLEAGGRVAVLRLTPEMLQSTGSTTDDTEGLINLPLTAKEIEAVIMFKSGEREAGEAAGADTRVSLRSKGTVDVRGVATHYGGGGHKNAAGLTLTPPSDAAERDVIARVVAAVQHADTR
ncbi:MAG: bifunctional oligoribonuclease/PAP phosphatase NrnA [Acidobacteriota bacterium]|nr:bifunctional oligoribonuclease/PAP phosphatase NrnA [Acidobacteriota bacterium]